VVVEGVAAEGEEDQVPPASVGGRLGIEDDRNEEADVLDAPSLVVELHHVGVGRIVPDDRSRSRGRGPDVRRGWKAEEPLGFGDLAGQGVGRVALALPSESGLTHASPALRSRSTRSDESGDQGGVRTVHHGRRRPLPRGPAPGLAAGTHAGAPSAAPFPAPWPKQRGDVRRHAQASCDGSSGTPGVCSRGGHVGRALVASQSGLKASSGRVKACSGRVKACRRDVDVGSGQPVHSSAAWVEVRRVLGGVRLFRASAAWVEARRVLGGVRRFRARGQSRSRAGGQADSCARRGRGRGGGSGRRLLHDLRPGRGWERREVVELEGRRRGIRPAGHGCRRRAGQRWRRLGWAGEEETLS